MKKHYTEIVSDADLAALPFGENTERTRAMIDEGVLKMAFGYWSGSTVQHLLRALGLAKWKRLPIAEIEITPKGCYYLRARFNFNKILEGLKDG